MKKFIRVLALTLVVMLALTACGGQTQQPAGNSNTPAANEPANTDGPNASTAEYVLRMGGTVNEEHPMTQTERWLVDRVWELTDGRVYIDLYPNCQLGTSTEMLASCMYGELDMTEISLIYLSAVSDHYNFFFMPDLFASKQAALAFMQSDWCEENIAKPFAEETNCQILSYIDDNYFGFTSNELMRTPDDLHGFKLRVQDNALVLEMWEELGASPTVMAYSEIYTALQQGALDGQHNGVNSTLSGAFDEVQNYYYNLGLVYNACCFIINNESLAQLPQELQDALIQACDEATTKGYELTCELTAESMQQIAEAVTVVDLTDEEYQQWVDACSGLMDFFKAEYPEIDIDAIYAEVETYNAEFPRQDDWTIN